MTLPFMSSSGTSPWEVQLEIGKGKNTITRASMDQLVDTLYLVKQ
jgi:hypothetical protein